MSSRRVLRAPGPYGGHLAKPRFVEKLRDQVSNEFAAHQQYIALAVWFDGKDLPQLARYFYRQSVEERNHAMMIVQYMLDRDMPVEVPGVPAVRTTTFARPLDLIALALQQEKQVTAQIEELFRLARSESDPLGEQFLLWFLKGAGRGGCLDDHAPYDRRASGRQLVRHRGLRGAGADRRRRPRRRRP